MHTPEQASELWCPMARVAQVGAVETHATYNRSLSKTHRPVKAAYATPDSFELGDDTPKVKDIIILDIELGLSGAAMCVADKCAMWRWAHTTESVPVITEGPSGAKVRTFRQEQVKTLGYCGIAGRPEVAA